MTCVARIALAATLAVSIAAPDRAEAQGPAVAITPFGGRNAGPMRRAVERALEGRARSIDLHEVDQAARDAAVSRTDPEGVADLAAALSADLVLQGSVSGSRRRSELELVLRAADGTELARGQITYRGRSSRDDLEDEVESLLERASAALAARAGPDEALARGAEPRAPQEAAAPAPDDGLALFALFAGMSLATRDARVEPVASAPRLYVSEPYPELVLAAELRPFASESHLGRGLFVSGTFAHSLGLGSRNMETGEAVSTNFVRFALGVGWLAPIAEVAEIGVGLSFAYDGYHLGPNVILPTAEYMALRPALRARVRVAEETFVIDAELAYRGVVSMGPIAPEFGDSAGAHGVDVRIGLGGNLLAASGLGFTWALRFEWVAYFLEFSRLTGDASGTETALRGVALIGWSFR